VTFPINDPISEILGDGTEWRILFSMSEGIAGYIGIVIIGGSGAMKGILM
jgi:hypothetical protein